MIWVTVSSWSWATVNSCHLFRIDLLASTCESIQFSHAFVSNSLTPWTAAHQASLSITNSQSFLKLMSFELVMPSNHLQVWMRASKTMIQHILPPPQWLLRGWGNARRKVNKETGLTPDSWGVYGRHEFSDPRGLHLPIHRMLNSLTWYLIFDVQTASCLYCKLVCSLNSHPASFEQFSQS